ncbi:metal ABC transporter substrate-binding protein [Luteococcus sp. OSA5]|uniref:metal ABC transporter substrate-binding protein n=1 Tax=Luteococcus sp. OSA5 TaxID=3401630 RepID=UPI003B434F26
MKAPLRQLTAAVACGALLSTAACSSTDSPASDDDRFTVVTAFYPLQFVAERVAGEDAEVVSLTNPGADAHSVELTPRQVASLSEADLVIYVKGFSSSIDKAIEVAQPSNVIDAMTLVEPLQAHDDHEDETPEEHAQHADEEEHAEEGEHAEGDHDHGANDPHIWLDPTNMVKITQAVADQLAEQTPEQAEPLKAKATQLTKELTQLDQSFTQGLASCQRKEIVVSHEAFGYLTHAYGLEQIGIAGISTEDEPSPSRIAEIQQVAKKHKITTIFYETQASPAHSKAIAKDLGLKTAVLDPATTLTSESKGKDYLEVMRANLSALKTANGCQ